MNAESTSSSSQTAPRDIIITNAAVSHGNIEAWINIIHSYEESHPGQKVVILYEGEEVNNLTSLFRRGGAPHRQGFQLVVVAPDGQWKDVPKLYRLLVDGGSASFERYLNKEVFQVLKLF